MLERFLVPEKDRIYISEEKMRTATIEIFKSCGLSDVNAKTSADVLITSDLRGCESHGVSNQLRVYTKMYNDGEINPRPNIEIVRETNATANLNGDEGLGLHVLPKAMEIAIGKAEKHGIGSVTVHNSRHIGMLAYYSMMPLSNNMIGFTTTAGNPLTMVPTNAGEKLFATNPWAWAAPAMTLPPFVFDVATTQVAGNKLHLAKRVGADIEPSWIADTKGRPIQEPTKLPDEYMLLPFGGTREQGSHKGYGFAATSEILSTILSGMGPGFLMPPKPRTVMGHHVQAIKIDGFIDPDDFKKDIDKFLLGLINANPAPNKDRVIYPGLTEYEEQKIRKSKGIPYHSEVINWFESYKNEMDLSFNLYE